MATYSFKTGPKFSIGGSSWVGVTNTPVVIAWDGSTRVTFSAGAYQFAMIVGTDTITIDGVSKTVAETLQDELLVLFPDAEIALPFSPDDVSNLAVWIDATDAASITNVSGSASQINDKSGNGNHLIQATSGNRPVINATGGQNNLGYLAFNSSRTIGLASFVIPQPFTVFVVMKQKSFIFVKQLIDFGSANGLVHYGGVGDLGSGKGSSGDSLGMVAGSNYVFAGTMYSKTNNTSWHPFQALFSGATNSYMGMDFVNDLLTGNPGTAATTRLNIQGDIDFHELLVFSRDLSGTECNQVNQYLKTKYAFADTSSIMFIGDSITAGYNSGGTSVSWPIAYPQLAVSELTYPLHSVLAQAGGTTSGVFNLYGARAIKGLPGSLSKLCIMLGQNDGDSNVANYNSAMNTWLPQLIDAGFDPDNIIISSTPPTAAPTNTALRDAASTLATTYGTRYCNQHAYIAARLAASYTSGDNIHPDTEGHRNLADNLKLSLV